MSFHHLPWSYSAVVPKYENPNIQERSQASLGLVSEVIDGLNMRGAQLEPYPSPCSDVSVTFKPGIQTRLLPNSWQFNIISSSSSLPTISYAKNSVNKFWWGLDVLNLRRRLLSLIKKQDARRKKVMSWQLVFMFGARLSINAAPRTETLSKLNYKTLHHHSLSHNICTICIKNNFLETILAKTWTRILKTIRNCAKKSRNLRVDGWSRLYFEHFELFTNTYMRIDDWYCSP